ncbi:transcription factor with AP2 domain(s) [Babesia ovis]|uniref:Transcription factor with AP2 domain(S) n=1 Tax=Babesia ovis TaxID=5869 RepID=A0A9W5TA41_BABOV|nr:transcription factor with AP2 domain(s) [Babesia ovis]
MKHAQTRQVHRNVGMGSIMRSHNERDISLLSDNNPKGTVQPQDGYQRNKQYRTDEPGHLASTMACESLDLSKWTREQLEEQLMILKQKEAAMQMSNGHWTAGQMGSKRGYGDVHSMGRMAPPHSMPAASAVPVKRRALSEMQLKQKFCGSDDLQYPLDQKVNLNYQHLMYDKHNMNQASYNLLNTRKNSKYSANLKHLPAGEMPASPLTETVAIPPLCRMETKLITTDDASQRSSLLSDVESDFGCESASQLEQPSGSINGSFSNDLQFSQTSNISGYSQATNFDSFSDNALQLTHSVTDLQYSQTSNISGYSHGTTINGLNESGTDGAYDWKHIKSEETIAREKQNFANTLSPELKKHYLNFTKHGVLSNELRQEYIRRSKLYPKVRGVWFNSTVRRMGWVGQAYKKCKRIEKIFSISKHGFDGARELAIAFRNSQKPANGAVSTSEDSMLPVDTAYDNASNDFPVSETIDPGKGTLRDDMFMTQGEMIPRSLSTDDATNVPDEAEVDGSQKTQFSELGSQEDLSVDDLFETSFNLYKTDLTPQQVIHRDQLCKRVLRFMLHELSTLVDLNIPMPRMDREACQAGIQYHLRVLDGCKHVSEMLPYVAIFGGYICLGITPLDMPFSEVYSILRALSHSKPLGDNFNSCYTKPFVEEDDEVNLVDLIVV